MVPSDRHICFFMIVELYHEDGTHITHLSH